MKAYRHAQPLQSGGKGRFGGHPIRLTIALIVKNEEKTLDRCLSSLKPLLDAVPSELIVTDTGSTDSTVEIAQKYADKIINFDWCGDFSAARNTGVKAARGQWFMFIDGDEWFESTEEIISFFTSGECDRYGSASYIQRNYVKPDSDKQYGDFHALRLFKVYPGMRFRDIVHEWIPWAKPLKLFNNYVHHYGYAYRDYEDRRKKALRNIPLLKKEIAEDEFNLKAYYQIGKEYLVLKYYDEAIKCGWKMLEIEKSHKNKIWRLSTMHNIISAYYLLKKYDELIQITDGFLRDNPEPEIIYLDFLYFANDAAFRLKRYEKSAELGERYIDIYRQYKSGKLDESMLLYADFSFITEKSRQRLILTVIWSYLFQAEAAQKERALPLLDELTVNAKANNSVYTVFFSAAQFTGRWETIQALFSKALASGEDDSRSKFIACTEKYIAENSAYALNAEDAVASMPEEDPFVYLNRLRRAENSGSHDEALGVLQWFLDNEKVWDDRVSDVLYFAMKEKINIMPYLLKIDTDDLKYFAAAMGRAHSDFTEVMLSYFSAYSFGNAKGLYFTVLTKEKILLSENGLDDGAYMELFESYAVETARYTRLLFRREMFQQVNVPALPRAYRFGYYIGEALDAKKRFDSTAYLQDLRLALEAYPVMAKPVNLLLEKAAKAIESKKAKADEFNLLAAKVKAQIESLIAGGDLKQAAGITEQLAKLMPHDADIARYRELTHTQPNMAELASGLPQ